MKNLMTTFLRLSVLSTPAFAADSPAKPKVASTANECSSLEHRFDHALKANITAPRLKRAHEQRAEGAELCARGQTAEGVAALKLALRDIGQKA